MKSRKSLITLLAAFSCLPVSNASENTSNLDKSSVSQKDISSSDSNKLNSTRDSLQPIKPSKSAQNSKKPVPPEPAKDEKKTNQSLSVGKAIAFTLLGTGVGTGGTLLTQHLMSKPQTPDTIPATVKSFLWNCAVISHNWDDVQRDNDPYKKSGSWWLERFYGGISTPRDKKNVTTLFNALLELYSKISALDEFKKLNFENPDQEILNSIEMIVFFPATEQKNGKYVYCKPEANEVHAKMQKNSEIKVNGNISKDGVKVEWTATFACDGEGNITLKDFNIKKT